MTAMKKMLFLVMASAVVLLSACSDYTGKEKSHPLFQQGGNCEAGGNYTDAVKAYEEFLMIAPKSAITHYKLATIYGDNLDNPLKAVYHYQKYAELADPNSGDANSVREFIELSKRKLYEKYKAEYKASGADSDLAALTAERDALKGKLDKWMEYSKKLQLQNTEMKNTLKNIAAERGKGGKKVHTGTGSSTSSTSAAGSDPAAVMTTSGASAAGGSAGTVKTGDTYTVKAGDTLMKISRTVYGSGVHYKQILQANKDLLGEDGNKLRVGQVLKIPTLSVSGN